MSDLGEVTRWFFFFVLLVLSSNLLLHLFLFRVELRLRPLCLFFMGRRTLADAILSFSFFFSFSENIS